ncbi:MAG: L,D-transpeptidase family protein, partial [Patescibacteria group bacterium]|nr:L,D-transpeptidase family protein [Patescibacteria group bacterium]
AYTAIMHVTLKHHQRVVYALLGVLLILFVFLILILSDTRIFNDPPPKYPATPAVSFLHKEEMVIIKSAAPEEKVTVLPVTKVLFEYVEITDGCGVHFQGECLNVRSGPGTEYPVVTRLRNGIVLKIGGKVERDGYIWYKIVFDEWMLYPERIEGDWYVAADYVHVLLDEGDHTIWDQEYATTTKQIIIDRSEQTLFAFEDGVPFMEEKISTGLELTPTPRGTFTIFKKTPSRYMQGPIPNIADQYYDLPGVPWNLYFTHEGAVIHGAYWHNSFGSTYSHGCVNLPPDQARRLYNWADLGTRVIVKD